MDQKPSAAATVSAAPTSTLGATTPNDGTVLPFPLTPTASVAAPSLQESKHQRRVEENHLPKDAPNVLIVLLDDVGFGLARLTVDRSIRPRLRGLRMKASATTRFTQRRSARPPALPC